MKKLITILFALLMVLALAGTVFAGGKQEEGGSTEAAGSGSAAGMSCGFFPLALGSQTVGSVIRPAAFCGG